MRRFAWEREVLKSGLPSGVRHLLLTLAVYADWPSGTTPAEHTPSLSTLAGATGLGRSTVARALDTAEGSGWLARHRPEVARARADKERTRYTLLDRASPTAGLVASPAPGLPSATAGLELVPQRDTGLVPQRDTSQNAFQNAPAPHVREVTDDDIRAEIRRRKGPAAADALIDHCFREDGPQIRAEIRAKREKAAAKKGIADARKKTPCEHGDPGGGELHSTSGLPLCPLCRMKARRSA